MDRNPSSSHLPAPWGGHRDALAKAGHGFAGCAVLAMGSWARPLVSSQEPRQGPRPLERGRRNRIWGEGRAQERERSCVGSNLVMKWGKGGLPSVWTQWPGAFKNHQNAPLSLAARQPLGADPAGPARHCHSGLKAWMENGGGPAPPASSGWALSTRSNSPASIPSPPAVRSALAGLPPCPGSWFPAQRRPHFLSLARSPSSQARSLKAIPSSLLLRTPGPQPLPRTVQTSVLLAQAAGSA